MVVKFIIKDNINLGFKLLVKLYTSKYPDTLYLTDLIRMPELIVFLSEIFELGFKEFKIILI